MAVLAYHVGWLPGGWLGVDVFFTLSGFLITTLLLEEHARTGTIAIGRFYVRRARRLLPALGLLLGVCGGVLLAAYPAFWAVIGRAELAVLGYVANWASLDGRVPLGVFGHTWSLAIEEQFYLVWPVLLFGGLRWLWPRWLLAALVSAAGGSLAWRLTLAWAGGATLPRIYLGTDTHADGLLLGAALALWSHHGGAARLSGVVRHAGSLLAAVALVGALMALPHVPGYVYGGTLLVALATGTVLLVVARGGSWVTRRLEWPGLVSLGRISYGVYLWHFPVFHVLGVLHQPGALAAPIGRALLAWVVTLAIAAASYWLLERRFLGSSTRMAALHAETGTLQHVGASQPAPSR